jgi:hypothetical protein
MFVFWIPQGGLGNLVFQYQAMVAHCPSAQLFVMPDTELPQVFALDSRCFRLRVPRRLRARFIAYWGRVLGWMAHIGVMSLIEPESVVVEGSYYSEISTLSYRPGWFKSVVFRGYFQSRNYALPAPQLAPQHLAIAYDRLASMTVGTRVAIHLRFGDYRDWSVLGQRGLVLPRPYYLDAMHLIREKVVNPSFIVFSDDADSAKRLLGEGADIQHYEGSSAAEDLAAMSLCNHAIISASTFAWWGAALISSSRKIVIAPRYWLGFKSRRWFPSTMQDPKLTFIDVSEHGINVG